MGAIDDELHLHMSATDPDTDPVAAAVDDVVSQVGTPATEPS
jgi:hypothetical protein